MSLSPEVLEIVRTGQIDYTWLYRSASAGYVVGGLVEETKEVLEQYWITTWAWLSEKQKRDIHETGRALHSEEWVGGVHPFVNDWISEPTAFRAIMTEKRDIIFPNHVVSSLRRKPDGSVRRINKWTGAICRKQISLSGLKYKTTSAIWQENKMIIEQIKGNFLSVLVVIFAVTLSGCAQENIKQYTRQQWTVDADQDQCKVSKIVQDYRESQEWRNGRSYGLDFYRQDEDALLRIRHRSTDWNLLDYINLDNRYQFRSSCKSDFTLQQLVSISQYGPVLDPKFRSDQEGMRRYGSVSEYSFHTPSTEKLLCRVTPFRHRLPSGHPLADGVWKTGRVQSCINVATGAKTFNVIRDN